jgi:hypothetical protein
MVWPGLGTYPLMSTRVESLLSNRWTLWASPIGQWPNVPLGVYLGAQCVLLPTYYSMPFGLAPRLCSCFQARKPQSAVSLSTHLISLLVVPDQAEKVVPIFRPFE